MQDMNDLIRMAAGRTQTTREARIPAPTPPTPRIDPPEQLAQQIEADTLRADTAERHAHALELEVVATKAGAVDGAIVARLASDVQGVSLEKAIATVREMHPSLFTTPSSGRPGSADLGARTPAPFPVNVNAIANKAIRGAFERVDPRPVW